MRTIIVQLTDLHLRPPGELAEGRIDTARFLQQAVAAVLALPQTPHAWVITGDLADHGLPAEYRQLRELLAPLRCPVFLLPGNHDDAGPLRSECPEHAYLGTEGDVRYSVPVGDVQLIAVDTTVRGQPHGALDTDRLRWLAAALDACNGRPIIVAMHHPPFRTLIGHMDAMGLLEGADGLEALVRAHPRVERVICGHVHRPVQVRFGGSIASICPSPAHQVALDLRPDAPAAWTFEPGAFLVHAWDPATGLVTHQAYGGRFPGPYPFDD
ncbi:MAG TPA: phosphodiesterase [Ramlibacter sp.]|uniref:phosphodiesterase n=1 Tax=Ramlibacter sp. TaxID=1917967 RepID=UPI002ED54769